MRSLPRYLAVVGQVLAAVLARCRHHAPSDGEAGHEDDVLVEHDAGLGAVPVGFADGGRGRELLREDSLSTRLALSRLELGPGRRGKQAAGPVSLLRLNGLGEPESGSGWIGCPAGSAAGG